MSPFDRESDPMPCRHVDHFSCAKCEKPFLGGRYFEKAGLAYCETHFLQLFGSVCYVCDKEASKCKEWATMRAALPLRNGSR